jgi:hypothetical protein
LLERIRATGAEVRHVSRWLRAVSVRALPAELERIRRLPEAAAIRPVASLRYAATSLGESMSVAPASGTARQAFDSAFYGPNWSALREMGIPALHAVGLTGSAVRIAILDTGFEPRHESLLALRVLRARDFINGDSIVSNEPQDPTGLDAEAHGTAVWSILGGRRPGQVVGPAFDAHFFLAKVDNEPGDTQVDEDNWVAAVQWADSQGVRVINSSVGFRFDFTDKPAYPFAAMDGNTTVTTVVADEAARRGIVVVVAIGNNGPANGTLVAPSDADSVVAVGAVDALGSPATFDVGATARGPSADGRQKPELVARGVGLRAASSLTTTDYTPLVSGTSFSAALMSGAAALFLQAWPDYTPIEMRTALQLAGNRASSPDNATGHGVPNVASAIMFPAGLNAGTVSPIDLQGVSVSIAPTFSWSAPRVHPLLRPVLYTLEIATEPIFTNIIYTDTVRDAFSLQLRTPLRQPQLLWWRVTGAGPLGVTRTTNVSGPFSSARWVQLLRPTPNRVEFVNDPRPEFSWSPIAAPEPFGPLSYDLEVLDANTGQLAQPPLRNLNTANVRLVQPLVPNVDYRWRVIVHTQTGAVDTVASSSSFVVTSNEQPPATLLYQNFPNPFPRGDLGTAETRVWFDLATTVTVELTIFDQRGRFVKRLIPAEPGCGPVTLPPGQYGRDGATGTNPCVRTHWDGRDEQGRQVQRGIYVLRMRTNGAEQFVRIVFLPERL